MQEFLTESILARFARNQTEGRFRPDLAGSGGLGGSVGLRRPFGNNRVFRRSRHPVPGSRRLTGGGGGTGLELSLAQSIEIVRGSAERRDFGRFRRIARAGGGRD